MIYIHEATGKRVNIAAPFGGFSRLDTPEIRARAGVVSIEDDQIPADFDPEYYEVREDWETTQRPYTVYTRKSDEQIAEILVARYESILDQHLDSIAKAHRFKDRHSLALRAGYPSAYQALGTAFATWMDGCNVQAYQRLQRVIAGEEQMPTIEAFINDLPEFVAP